MKKIILFILLLVTFSVSAEEISIIVPFPSGGAYDIVARKFAQFITDETPNHTVVNNIVGAGGYIGLKKLESSPPNTVILAQSSSFYGGLIEHQIPLENFKLVAVLAESPYFLVVSKNNGLTCEKLKNTQKYFFAGTGGKNTSTDEIVKFIKEKYSNFQDVPYKGVIQTLTDLISGQIDLTFFSGLSNSRPEIIFLANTSPVVFDGIPTLKSCLGIEKTITNEFILVANNTADISFLKQMNQLAYKFIEDSKTKEYFKTNGINSRVDSLEKSEKIFKFNFLQIQNGTNQR